MPFDPVIPRSVKLLRLTGTVPRSVRGPQQFSARLVSCLLAHLLGHPVRTVDRTMSFDEDRILPPSATNAVHCSGECYRQCSPESCPGLTAQCTDKCVVVACSDPHDGDNHQVCGDIVCDDQSCTDPTGCHGIYDFVGLPLAQSLPIFSNPSSRLFFASLGLNPIPCV